jgi:peptidoglycan/LPS O-acetylase OafA/YrhL
MLLPLKKTYSEPSVTKSGTVAGNRIAWSDHARGIAIMLVVYRHVTIGMQRAGIPVGTLMYNGQEIFYNFRMAVFFILSGLFVANSLKKKSANEVFRNRVTTIFYPYLVWAVILMSLEVIFSRFTNSKRSWLELTKIIYQPRDVDHLWYLYTLFSCSALYFLFRLVTKNVWVNAFLAVAVHVINFYFIDVLYDYSLISDTFIYYTYFFVGTCLPGLLLDKERSAKVLDIRNLWWLTPLCLAGQYFWFVHENDRNTWYAVFFLINLVACYVVFILMNRLAKNNGTAWLSYLGKYSLYIYILHVPISAIFRAIYLHSRVILNSWIVLGMLWTIGLLLPILLMNVGRPYGIERLFSLKTKKDS